MIASDIGLDAPSVFKLILEYFIRIILPENKGSEQKIQGKKTAR